MTLPLIYTLKQCFNGRKELVDSIGEALQPRQKAGKRSHRKVKAAGVAIYAEKKMEEYRLLGIGDSIGIPKRRIPRRPRIDGELRSRKQ